MMSRTTGTFGYEQTDRGLETSIDVPRVVFFYEKSCKKCRAVYNYVLEPLERHRVIYLNKVDVNEERSPEYDWWRRATMGVSGKGTPLIRVEEMLKDPMEGSGVYLLHKKIDDFTKRVISLRKRFYKDLRDNFDVKAFDELAFDKILKEAKK